MKCNKAILYFSLSFIGLAGYAQEIRPDSIDRAIAIEEVIITGDTKKLHQKQSKSLATIDEFLEKSPKVNMVKRGGYAWEPLINSMATERTIITIDGMRIFGACTDKMDPVTSYVEVSNLSKVQITSGQQGNTHGATIGGGLDLKRYSIRNREYGYRARFISGYETNNQQKIIGTSLGYNDSLFYANADFTLRDAENYKAGNSKEIAFSQFRKYNLSGVVGYVPNSKTLIEGSVIYDKATDVGYPALTMDVSLAEALISTVRFERVLDAKYLKSWETKLYFNTITHTMDDTKRPNVPVHMDMPGWSDTYGMYSRLKGASEKHDFSIQFSGFYNRSVAEMTMYPDDPNENLMFMYTWPDVRTLYSGISAEDTYSLTDDKEIKLSTNLGFHTNEVADDFGLQSLRIFYPEMASTNSRFLKSISANYIWYKNNWIYNFGGAYGERAPSVSEGYGFYLYNSNDFYDYVGNPYLANEKSFEGNFAITYHKFLFHAKWTASYFHIQDYIVGKVDASVSPMTIGATGVKRYIALDYATIFTTGLELEQKFLEDFKAASLLTYTHGKGSDNLYLPFMSPFSYRLSLSYLKENFGAELSMQGSAKHTQYAFSYGENRTVDYAILGASTSYALRWDKSVLNLQLGVENILDTYYTTFADWNKIPRAGRNVFLNVEFEL
jgi:iron complex outermembrane receptor protein